MATLLHLTGRAVTDANGAPYPAAVAHFYIAGTTTDQDTYTTAALSVENENPVVSDASTGIFPAIYLAAKRYKVVIKDASGNTLQTWEVVDDAEHVIYSESEPSPTFPRLKWVKISTRILSERNSDDDDWINRGDVDAGLNTASITETLAGTEAAKAVTPDGLAAFWETGSDVAISTNNISLPSTGGGQYVCGTATTTLTTISSAVAGREIEITFSNSHTITHGSGINTPTGANEPIPAGMRLRFRRVGTEWTITNRTIGEALQSDMEAATSNFKPVTPGRQHYHPGHPKFWAEVSVSGGTPTLNSSYNVSGITDEGAGDLTVTINNDLSVATYPCVVTCERSSTGLGVGAARDAYVRNASKAVGAVRVECADKTATNMNLVDPASWSVVGLGDI